MTRSSHFVLLTSLLLAPSACGGPDPIGQDQQPVDLDDLQMERVADGFGITEGPYWHEDGYLLFVDVQGSKIYRWSEAEGVEVHHEPSGRANGIAMDGEGNLIVAQRDRRLSRISPDGRETVLVEDYRGARLNSPNDIAMKSDGSVYFTDPPFGIEEEEAELGFNGVYRLLPDGTLQLLVDDFTMPNGLAFSPDESSLYVADSVEEHVRVFDVGEDGGLSNGRVFATLHDPERSGDPDGMEVDAAGTLYVAGPGGVWVFAPDGALRTRIMIPEEHTTNLTWGGDDGRTLYVTAVSNVEGSYVGRLYRLRHPTESPEA